MTPVEENLPPVRRLWSATAGEIRQLMRVALGEEKADLVIRDGTVANVYTGELQEHCSLAVKGRRIAYLGRDCSHAVGDDTEVVDASGKVLIPGFIDGHSHVLNRYGIEEFVRGAIPTGTTTVVTEMLEMAFSVGIHALGYLLDAFRAQPIRVLATLPAMVSIDPAWSGITPAVDDYAALFTDDAVVGLGESYWAGVLRGAHPHLDLIALALAAGKSLEGHSAGASGPKLQAYVATGQTSCHEPISVDQAIERLRLGVSVMLRQGATRDDLLAAAPFRDAHINLRRLLVVSDSVDPEHLLHGKYMNTIVQNAIDRGYEPLAAIQMASLNVAEHFHLDRWLGGLAPGRYADLSIIPALGRIEPECVVSDGQIISREGQVIASPHTARFPAAFSRSINLRPEFRADDFQIHSPSARKTCFVYAIQQITDLVTERMVVEMPVLDGLLVAQPADDVIKVAAIERRKGQGERFIGFLHGHGLARGAFATTMAWDTTSLLVIGTDEADMAMAVNRLVELQGGAVVSTAGKVIAEFRASLGGFVSDRPLAEVVQAMVDIQRAVEGLGSTQPRHLLSLDTLSTAAIPYFRISHAGYYHLREGKAYPLFA